MDPTRPRSRAEPRPDVAAALADLDRLGRDRPELLASSRPLAAALVAAFASAGGVQDGEITPDSVLAAARSDRPLFRVERPAWKVRELNARAIAIGDALHATNPAGRSWVVAIKRGKVDLAVWAKAALDGDPTTIDAASARLGLDPALAATVLRLTLLPALAPRSAAADRRRPDGCWRDGACPDCGSPPLLAEERGLEARRFLRCGLCAGDWPAERLRCPACSEGDPNKLRRLVVEGDEARHRLAVCESCGFRLKVVATLGPLTAPGLVVAELATVHLDWIDLPDESA